MHLNISSNIPTLFNPQIQILFFISIRPKDCQTKLLLIKNYPGVPSHACYLQIYLDKISLRYIFLQGGTWTPSNPSGSVLLIVCLFFAVVTYNAYAAFITSVLSVRVASVDTIAAVLHSPNFKIGYIRNGADQMYLMVSIIHTTIQYTQNKIFI